MWKTGSTKMCVANAMTGSIIGGFGHSFIHQPKYRLHAYVLDLIGFSSSNWFHQHNMQHHIYTNTTGDNHFEGTSPFIVPDPTREKLFLHHVFSVPMFFVVLTYGVPGNYLGHTIDLLMGREEFSWAKFFVPMQIALMYRSWGTFGAFLVVLSQGLCGTYYFLVALANHNAEFSWDLDTISTARDWGEQQIMVSGDIHTDIGYYMSTFYLWLNYHCVHHLCPTVDMWHHPAIQKILIKTSEEFDIKYRCWSLSQLFVSMTHGTFSGASKTYLDREDMLPSFQVTGFKSQVSSPLNSPSKLPTMGSTSTLNHRTTPTMAPCHVLVNK